MHRTRPGFRVLYAALSLAVIAGCAGPPATAPAPPEIVPPASPAAVPPAATPAAAIPPAGKPTGGALPAADVPVPTAPTPQLPSVSPPSEKPPAGPVPGSPPPAAGPGSETAAELPPFPAPNLSFFNAVDEELLPAGMTTEIVQHDLFVRLHLHAAVDLAELERSLVITPAEAREGPIDWFDWADMAQIHLSGLKVGQSVSIALSPGLKADGFRPLDRDFIWTLRRVRSTELTITVQAPNMVQYTPEQYMIWVGQPANTANLVAMGEGQVTVDLRFSQAVNPAAVEVRLRERLTPVQNLKFQWFSSAWVIATGVLTAAPDTFRYIDLYGVPDGRGLPIDPSPAVELQVQRSRPLYRWTAAGGNQELNHIYGGLVPLTGRQAGSGQGLILWHTLGDDGDALIRAPWVIDLTTGKGRVIGRAQTHYHDLAAYWLPDGNTIAINTGDGVQLVTGSGQAVGRLSTAAAPPGFLMGMAVNPQGGQVAVFEAWPAGANPFGTVDLVAIDLTGQETARLKAASLLAVADGFPLPVSAAWLPDGRIAYVQWMSQGPADRAVGRLAVADLAAGRIVSTDVPARRILDATPAGTLLLDGGRLYTAGPAGLGSLTAVAAPGAAGAFVGAFSADGSYLALGTAAGVGVLGLSNNQWTHFGRGQLVGWGPGGLYWLPDAPSSIP